MAVKASVLAGLAAAPALAAAVGDLNLYWVR